jgi:restriction system protein
MAEITKRRKGEIQQAVLRLLAANQEGVQAKEVISRCAESLTPTAFEKSEFPDRPGSRRFDWILRFSTIALVKAGWIVKSSGTWTITADGKKALADFKDPEALERAARTKYYEWKAGQPEEDDQSAPLDDSDATRAVATLEEAEEDAWLEISNYLAEMPPYDFQELVGGLLRGLGYHVSHIAPPGRDQGTDITAHVDPLGIQGTRIKVQVKRRADKIDVDGVRSFLAVLGSDDAGIFVCTGGFTSEAQREARTQERRKIMLVDARRLFDLWVEHYDKIPDEQRRFLPLKSIYYLNLEK